MPRYTLTCFQGFSPENIILRLPNWIGDCVMATPVIQDIKRQWPQTKITAMCQEATGDLIDFDPHVDEILKFKKPNGWLPHLRQTEILETLNQGQYDLGVILTNSFSSAWWFWRANIKQRIGYATHFRSWLLTTAIPLPKDKEKTHLVQTYKNLLCPLGIPLSGTSPKLYLQANERSQAKSFLNANGIEKQDIIIGINPGAAYGAAKCWLPERFLEVSLKLIKHPNVKLLYFGDKSHLKLIQDITQNLKITSYLNLAGKTTLRELMAFISCCDLFLTNDSGPMHIASALGIPLVALFGSTSSIKTGPYNGGTVINKQVPCSPCYQRKCPIDFSCMKTIEVQEVYEELQKIIENCKKSN